MNLNPRLLIIVVAIGIAIFFTQRNNNDTQEGSNNSVQQSTSSETEKASKENSAAAKPAINPLVASVESINFPDSELKRCVLDEIKEGADSANIHNISQLTKLQCNAFKITSLEGIEKLSSLKEVTIIGSDIQDASPLSRIDSLEKIYLKGGNSNIQNIDSLSQLNNLKKISFPHLMQTYCYEAKSVIKSMKENIEGPTSNNLSLMHCRGKKTYKVTSALGKVRNGEPLSSEESEALDDYEANLSWSQDN